MRRSILGAIAACGFVAAAGGVAAEEQQVTGTVSTVDEQTGTVVLDNGETFTLGEGATIQDIRAGDNVIVSYELQEGERVATDIRPAAEESETGTESD